MDRMGEKRKRSSNFQLSETRLLVDTVLPFKEIIENKANDSFHIQEKNRAWEKIASIFNSVGCGEVHRNSKVLKLKYEGIKKLLRRKLAEHKREMYVSGMESSPGIKMEDYEEKMFSIVLCNGEDSTRYEVNNHHERFDLSNTSTFDEDQDSPEIEEIKIKHERATPNIELVADNVETALNVSLNQDEYEPRTTQNRLKWKQFNNMRKLKIKKTTSMSNLLQLAGTKKELTSLQIQHTKTENINKLKYQDNEITKQELEINYLKTEHELRKQILEKELEEKEAILKRNDEEHKLKMRLLEIQLKHKELELLSKMN